MFDGLAASAASFFALAGITISMTALHSKQEAIEAEYAQVDEFPENVDICLGEIGKAIEELEERPVSFDPVDILLVDFAIHAERERGMTGRMLSARLVCCGCARLS